MSCVATQVHGEVFRRPPYLALFSALIGTGYQLVVMVLVGILCAITGSVYRCVCRSVGVL
jgi:transmembrane 9 superfamily protein 3